jgi:hypothetical protein
LPTIVHAEPYAQIVSFVPSLTRNPTHGNRIAGDYSSFSYSGR